METSDLTVQILRDIRDSIDNLGTNLGARIDATNERLDRTNERLDRNNERLDHLEIHLAGEILALRTEFVSTRELLTGRRDLQNRVDRCEREIVAIKEKLAGSR
jgi:hypothetical protein